MPDDVTLNIDGTKFYGWESTRIRRSFESIADSFELTLSDRWQGLTVPPVRNGVSCKIEIDDETVITGYIDDVYPVYDAQQHTLQVVGRSKTADLVDCSYASNENFKGKTFLQVADTVCLPFDINVELDADVGAPFANKQVMERGESVFEFLDRLARYRALRLVSTPDGNLLITRASKQKIATPIVLGGNILSASGVFSNRDRFSEYLVYGQQTDSFNTLNGTGASEPHGSVNDSGISRYRPTVIVAGGNINTDECNRQAQWHRNTRFGRGNRVVYRLLNWRHANGLWQPNRLVDVADDYAGINGERIISEVAYVMNEGGKHVELEVMPPEAFDLVPLPEAA